MGLEARLRQLEVKVQFKQPGCNPILFILVPEGSQNAPFDTDAYRPTDNEIEKYLKLLKDSGQCRDCKGSCAIDWSPEGFKNHTIGGGCSSSSPELKISWMFCADAEIPVLCRRLMNGEREPDKY
jgi:hypothetical protein